MCLVIIYFKLFSCQEVSQDSILVGQLVGELICVTSCISVCAVISLATYSTTHLALDAKDDSPLHLPHL